MKRPLFWAMATLPSLLFFFCADPGATQKAHSSSGDQQASVDEVVAVIKPSQVIETDGIQPLLIQNGIQHLQAALYLAATGYQVSQGSSGGQSPEGGSLSVHQMSDGRTQIELRSYKLYGLTYSSNGSTILTLAPDDSGHQLTGVMSAQDAAGTEQTFSFDFTIDAEGLGHGTLLTAGEELTFRNYDFGTGRLMPPKNETIHLELDMDMGEVLEFSDPSGELPSTITMNFNEEGELEVDYSALQALSPPRPTSLYALAGDDYLSPVPASTPVSSSRFQWWWLLLLPPPPPPPPEPTLPPPPPPPPPASPPPPQPPSTYNSAPGNRILIVGDSWAQHLCSGSHTNSNKLNQALNARGLGMYTSDCQGTAIIGSVTDIWLNLLGSIQTALDIHPDMDIVHLSIGGNDLAYSISPYDVNTRNAIMEKIENLVRAIHSMKPNLKINIMGYSTVDSSRQFPWHGPSAAFNAFALLPLEIEKSNLANRLRDEGKLVYYTSNIHRYGNPPRKRLLEEDGFHLTENEFYNFAGGAVDSYYRYWLTGQEAPLPSWWETLNRAPVITGHQLMWPGGVKKVWYWMGFPIAAHVYIDVHVSYYDPEGGAVWPLYYHWQNGLVEKTNNYVYRFHTLISWWHLHNRGGFTLGVVDAWGQYSERGIYFNW